MKRGKGLFLCVMLAVLLVVLMRINVIALDSDEPLGRSSISSPYNKGTTTITNVTPEE